MRKQVQIRVSYELLVEALHLPRDSSIAVVASDISGLLTRSFLVVVEHDDLPEVEGMQEPRLIYPKTKKNLLGKVEFDWNLQDE